jgi:xanthine/uracil permease
MKGLHLSRDNWLSGFQWFFFIFCNTVVIPPTLQSAFHLSSATTFMLTQYSFLTTAIACLLQAFFGHRRALMEGPGGLWWGTMLTLALAESAQGTPLASIGGSLVVGIALAGVLTVVIGVSGLGPLLARLFHPAVMVVFMFLLGAQLTTIFLKGMLGLPFGAVSGPVNLNGATFCLAVAVVIFIVAFITLLPLRIGKFAVLLGTLLGWIIYVCWFGSPSQLTNSQNWQLFPLGGPTDIRPGIVITAVLTGLVNISNTFGAIRGSDTFYGNELASPAQYRRSFIVSGVVTLAAAPLGVVPFSPFVSSIGLITQTRDSTRRAFIIGSLLFLAISMVPAFTRFFCAIPLTISSSVMLVAYLPLLWSSFLFVNLTSLNARNIYRIAIPLFCGVFLMGLPGNYLQQLPLLVRPLLSNGLLMGVLLAVALENLFPWDRVK